MMFLEERVERLEDEVAALRLALNAVPIRTLNGSVTPESILETIAAHYGVSRCRIIGKQRQQAIVKPRAVAMWLCSKLTPHERTELGRFFCKDQSTITYAINAVNNRRDTEPAYRKETDALLKQFEKEA